MAAPLVGQSVRVPNAKLRVLSSAEAKNAVRKLDLKQLPPRAKVTIKPTQEFALDASGTKELIVVPTYFEFDPPVGSSDRRDQCGVFFLEPSGKSQYVSVMGRDDDYVSVCEGALATGTMTDPGPRPRLILIFNGSLPNGNDYPNPFVMYWSPATESYQVDVGISKWLIDQNNAGTVSQIRHLLAHQTYKGNARHSLKNSWVRHSSRT